MIYRWLWLIPLAHAAFHVAFENFLVANYGPALAAALSRRDLGSKGSFGGTDGLVNQEAVVLVHGITNSAGTFGHIRRHLESHGHIRGTVYATTYGDAGRTKVLGVTVQCHFIKQVRMMVEAVSAYTRQPVDVIAFSLGSAVARKAILGGRCVDTGEDLGPPLTRLIDTYVSVAGANSGSSLCFLPFPGVCNASNGLHCSSTLIADINSRFHYEGRYVFSIYSRQDDKVGYINTCGGVSSRINGQDAEFVRGGKHDKVMASTAGLQSSLVQWHMQSK